MTMRSVLIWIKQQVGGTWLELAVLKENTFEPDYKRTAQSDFCKVYKVKDENMKKLDCASFPMVCGPMFLWSGPPGATKIFLPMDQRGDLSEIIFSLWSPL